MSDEESSSFSEAAAQHLVALKELGKNLAMAMPAEIEDQVCTAIDVAQRAPLIMPVNKKPVQDVTRSLICCCIADMSMNADCCIGVCVCVWVSVSVSLCVCVSRSE